MEQMTRQTSTSFGTEYSSDNDRDSKYDSFTQQAASQFEEEDSGQSDRKAVCETFIHPISGDESTLTLRDCDQLLTFPTNLVSDATPLSSSGERVDLDMFVRFVGNGWLLVNRTTQLEGTSEAVFGDPACYRRNIIKVQGAIKFSAPIDSIRVQNGLFKVSHLMLSVSARSIGADNTHGNPVAVVTIPAKTTGGNKKKGPAPEPLRYSFDEVQPDQRTGVSFGWLRLCFDKATENNGRNTHQQFYVMSFDLTAVLENGSQVNLAKAESYRFIVRGRSPGNFPEPADAYLRSDPMLGHSRTRGRGVTKRSRSKSRVLKGIAQPALTRSEPSSDNAPFHHPSEPVSMPIIHPTETFSILPEPFSMPGAPSFGRHAPSSVANSGWTQAAYTGKDSIGSEASYSSVEFSSLPSDHSAAPMYSHSVRSSSEVSSQGGVGNSYPSKELSRLTASLGGSSSFGSQSLAGPSQDSSSSDLWSLLSTVPESEPALKNSKQTSSSSAPETTYEQMPSDFKWTTSLTDSISQASTYGGIADGSTWESQSSTLIAIPGSTMDTHMPADLNRAFTDIYDFYPTVPSLMDSAGMGAGMMCDPMSVPVQVALASEVVPSAPLAESVYNAMSYIPATGYPTMTQAESAGLAQIPASAEQQAPPTFEYTGSGYSF